MGISSELPPYSLKRSKRKTLCIAVDAVGSVIIRAPLRMPIVVIEQFYREKAAWVKRHVDHQKLQITLYEPFSLLENTPLLLNGQEYPLCFRNTGTPVFEDGAFWVLPGDEQAVRRQLVTIYTKQAQMVLLPQIQRLSQQLKVQPAGVRIGSAKTSWGSCSGKNRINLSWRLVLVPPALQEYVLIHELAHILHHNHSKAFWQLVESLLPDYRERRKALAGFGRRIALEGWNN